ncbi:MAG: 4Fe-4S dicluster domain-containing protein [Anaerolineae bacterium]|jgi:heterodisulfide reductase subunit C|nr:4Fe-4S dicluster domain-containing protein [Anaerolineae bacterium]
MANVLNPFVVELSGRRGGDKVLQCYQCGTCSGSCPVIDEMEYGPRRILNMIQMGEEARVLSSHDMWFCVSCYSCASRCPREIPITELMATLREMAVEKGYAEDLEAEFGQSFAETFKHYGRLFEPELMIRYYLRTFDIKGLLGMIPLALPMVLKDKLPFFPERVKEPAHMTALCPEPHDAPPKAATRRKPRWLPWLASGVTLLLAAGMSSVFWRSTSRRSKEARR